MSKPKLNAILLCDKVEFFIPNEKEGEKIVIQGVFDNIYAKSFPAEHSSFVIYINMNIEPGEHKHSYEIRNMNDDSIVFSYPKGSFSVSQDDRRHQLIHKIDNFIIPNEGGYIVNIFIDGNLFAKTDFYAKKIPQSSYALWKQEK